MTVQGWSNLSLKKDTLARLKRLFDTTMDKETKWIDWISDALEGSLLREKFLKQNLSYIRFVGNVKNGCVLEDTRTKQVVNVTVKGNKITSVPHGEQYILYAIITPRFLIE